MGACFSIKIIKVSRGYTEGFPTEFLQDDGWAAGRRRGGGWKEEPEACYLQSTSSRNSQGFASYVDLKVSPPNPLEMALSAKRRAAAFICLPTPPPKYHPQERDERAGRSPWELGTPGAHLRDVCTLW